MEGNIIPGADEGGRQLPFGDVRAFYRTGEEVAVAMLPVGTSRIVARRATGDVVEADLDDGARFAELPSGTYAVEALSAGGDLLAEELTTVGAHPGERPVHGFATSFEERRHGSGATWSSRRFAPR
jgi:hypothetical protein